MNKQLLDKLFLLITSIASALLFFGLAIYLLMGVGISKEWYFFIGGCLAYTLGVIYTAIKTNLFKKNAGKAVRILILISIICFVIFSFFVLFYFKFLRLPNNVFPYLIGVFALGVATLNVFQYCLKFVAKKRKSNSKEVIKGCPVRPPLIKNDKHKKAQP